MDAAAVLARVGGVGSVHHLRHAGVGQDRLDRAVRAGRLLRIRRGWYALPDADPSRVRAVAACGVLSCVSALEQYGLWLMPFQRCHIRVEPNRRAPGDPALRIHWLPAAAAPMGGRDSLVTALIVAIECLSPEAALVAVDSALEKRLTTRGELQRAFAGRPRHLRVLSRAITSSESGTETLVRDRLRARGVTSRTQVRIDGVGRVDLLVGDRLIIEVDGRQHHDDSAAFTRDRRRDLAAVAKGYLPVRLSYRQVLFEWPAVERQLLDLIRRREHHWRASQRAAAQGG